MAVDGEADSFMVPPTEVTYGFSGLKIARFVPVMGEGK
jgi:hypothetical protein